MTEPAEVVSRMVGESLSLCIVEERSVVGVTNPDGNIVTFWDMEKQQFLKKLELKAPRGLTRTLDGSHLALSHGAGTLTLLSPETLEPVPLRRVPHLRALRLASVHAGSAGLTGSALSRRRRFRVATLMPRRAAAADRSPPVSARARAMASSST